MNLKSSTVAVVGCGVIGAGWIARFVENGVSVRAYDPQPQAGEHVAKVLENSARAYARLLEHPLPARGDVQFVSSIAEAVTDTNLIIEAVPEDPAIKKSTYSEIEEFASSTAMIASSTSGILPSILQAEMDHPERFLVTHPFNPVYLLPLVELVAGNRTDPAIIATANEFFTSIGMHPLHIRKEIEAFVADRLMEAVWRESLWLVKDGIATTEEIDDAIRYGFGLRWAQMGLFETFRLAGGPNGMRHFLKQFGPCLQWPWTKLTDVPEMDDELIELISSQSDKQSGGYSIGELEQIRDDNLVDILKALQKNQWGAGETLANYENSRDET